MITGHFVIFSRPGVDPRRRTPIFYGERFRTRTLKEFYMFRVRTLCAFACFAAVCVLMTPEAAAAGRRGRGCCNQQSNCCQQQTSCCQTACQPTSCCQQAAPCNSCATGNCGQANSCCNTGGCGRVNNNCCHTSRVAFRGGNHGCNTGCQTACGTSCNSGCGQVTQCCATGTVAPATAPAPAPLAMPKGEVAPVK